MLNSCRRCRFSFKLGGEHASGSDPTVVLVRVKIGDKARTSASSHHSKIRRGSSLPLCFIKGHPRFSEPPCFTMLDSLLSCHLMWFNQPYQSVWSGLLLSVGFLLSMVKCRATVRVLKHPVNTWGWLAAEGGVEDMVRAEWRGSTTSRFI